MNRQQRRLQEKTMRKAESISSQLHRKYQQELIAERMKDQEEVEQFRQRNITEDWHWFYSILGLTLYEKYHWNSDKIMSLFEKCDQTVSDAVANGTSRDDIAKKLEDLTGIVLALK
jgi:hypothetical protein